MSLLPRLSLDCETALIQPGLLAPELVCVSFATPATPPWLLDADRGVSAFRAALESGEIIIGHNAAFDVAVLAAHDPSLIPLVFEHYRKGLFRDTKVRQELLDIAQGRRQDGGNVVVFRGTGPDAKWERADYSLAGLERFYLGRDRSEEKHGKDAWRLRYSELKGTPVPEWPAEAVKYALEDAGGTLAVYDAQGGDVPNEIEQTQAAWALHLMSCWGIRSDGEAALKLEAALLIEQKKNFRHLKRAGFFKTRRATKTEEPDFWEESKRGPRPMVYAKDMAAIQAAVTSRYARLGKPAPTTDSGRIATDKDTLAASGSSILQLLSDGGGVDKILSTYVPVLKQGAEVPINARFNVLVNSGRTSCSKPNLQNLPTGRRVGGVREVFVPRPGFYFVSADYSTLELRALAQVCLWLFDRSRMAEVIREGKDLHSQMAADMTGLTYEAVEKEKSVKGSRAKKARDAAKVANFGFPGGLGSRTLVDYARTGYGVILTEQQSAELKAAWLGAWPEMNQYFQYINLKVGARGEADLEQFVSKRVRGGVGYCDGCNTLFQGLAADGAKAACFDVADECYVDRGTALYGSRPVVFVHDELVLEVPIECASEAADRLSEVMCASMSRYLPDVPVTASPALMTRWFKDAVELRDPNGKLLPWAPLKG